MKRRDFFKFLGVAPLAVPAALARSEDDPLADIAAQYGVERAPAAPLALIMRPPPHSSASERAAALAALLEVADQVVVLPFEYEVEFIGPSGETWFAAGGDHGELQKPRRLS
jgi:hypothetical protein